MDGRIIDCCSLLNLYTGWAGLTELSELNLRWHICEAVLKEADFTREFGKNNLPDVVPLDLSKHTESGLLLITSPETDEELDDYINFAQEIDDGEAQALAIAKHRGFILLTDDRKAINLAQRSEVSVRTISTAVILRAWAELSQGNAKRIPEILSRIEVLAKFRPSMKSSDFEWWQSNRY